MASLSEVFPDLAKQWDYERNEVLTPDDVSYGSNKIVWWKCPLCGHSYRKKIANRTAPAKRKAESDKCPVCLGRIIVPGFNSLKAKYPEIIEKEWDYELNKDTGYTPQNIGIDTRKKFYWHCNNGYNHSYLATIAFRVGRNSGCAICHGKQVSPDTSLGHLYPELVKEWCAENDKTPFEVTPRSEYRALWKCSNPEHKPFSRAVYYRTKYGAGCPYCRQEERKSKKN
nr:zinc-ribbon domain-containing protein [Bacteroides acidifaciens]